MGCLQSGDRISELPDDIRCHILSFMPTRDAITTCLLSHTWKHTWSSVLTVDVFVSRSRSARFVDQVLLYRGVNRILKFRFKGFCIKKYYDRFETWVDNVVGCGVAELELDVLHYGVSDEYVELPRSIFVCRTLVVLKIKLGPNVHVEVPDTLDCCLPSLKYLDVMLNRPQQGFNSIEKLVCSCPQLEDLIVCAYMGSLVDSARVNLSALKLRRLNLSMWGFHGTKDSMISVEANVPNLESLSLMGNIFAICSLDAKSLKDVKVEPEVYNVCPLFKYSYNIQFTYLIHKLFDNISSVEYLSLSARVLWYVDFNGKECHLPKFNYLSKLKLHYQGCCVWKLVMKLLDAAPNLENLVYDIDDNASIKCTVADHGLKDLVHERKPPEAVPSCILSCLKNICIRGFKATQVEIDVIEYLLKHGHVLDRVILHTSHFWEDTMVKFRQRCLKLQRGSESCKIFMVFTDCMVSYLVC